MDIWGALNKNEGLHLIKSPAVYTLACTCRQVAGPLSCRPAQNMVPTVQRLLARLPRYLPLYFHCRATAPGLLSPGFGGSIYGTPGQFTQCATPSSMFQPATKWVHRYLLGNNGSPHFQLVFLCSKPPTLLNYFSSAQTPAHHRQQHQIKETLQPKLHWRINIYPSLLQSLY